MNDPNQLVTVDKRLSAARWQLVGLLAGLLLLIADVHEIGRSVAAVRSELVRERGKRQHAEELADAHKGTIDKLLEELHAQRQGEVVDEPPAA